MVETWSPFLQLVSLQVQTTEGMLPLLVRTASAVEELPDVS